MIQANAQAPLTGYLHPGTLLRLPHAYAVLPFAEARVARCLLPSTQLPDYKTIWANFTLNQHNLSQAQLARILGLSRQSVGSILREFERPGFIRMGCQRIQVVLPDDLRRVVAGRH